MRFTLKFKKSVSLIIAICMTIVANGQILMHFDKPYYVTGETVWYKAYLKNSIPEGSMLSVKVVNKDQNIIHNSFIKVDGQAASGFFKIPYNTTSGNYAFVIEGKNSFASNIRIGEVTVPIYNDLTPGDLTYNDIAQPFNSYDMSGQLRVNISVLEDDILPGEPVVARVTVTDENGNNIDADCSISVVDQGLIGMDEGIGIAIQDLKQPYNDLIKELFYDGKVYDRSGRAIKANVLGAYTSHDDGFSFTKSNEDGNFILPIGEFVGVREIQFLGFQEEHPEIMAKLNNSTALSFGIGELRYTETIAQYLESSSIRKKINQYFKIKDKTNFIENNNDAGSSPKPQALYKVQEYQDFGTMAEFAKNMMMPLRFNGDKGQRKAQVINPKSLRKANYYLKGDPLFIVDGKLTRNADYVGNIEQSEVEELGIIYENKVLREKYNVMGSSGVVIINTTGRRDKLPAEDERNIATVNGLQTRVDYPVSINLGSHNKDLPSFDPQLYWNPKVTTGVSGNTSINFVQSSDRSTWRIVVVAKSKDGKIGIGTLDFTSAPAGE